MVHVTGNPPSPEFAEGAEVEKNVAELLEATTSVLGVVGAGAIEGGSNKVGQNFREDLHCFWECFNTTCCTHCVSLWFQSFCQSCLPLPLAGTGDKPAQDLQDRQGAYIGHLFRHRDQPTNLKCLRCVRGN